MTSSPCRICKTSRSPARGKRPQILADVATISRSQEMAAVDHYNIRRVIDIYANVQGRDLGARRRATSDASSTPDRHLLPRGSFVTVRGQVETMRGVLCRAVRRTGASRSCWSTC